MALDVCSGDGVKQGRGCEKICTMATAINNRTNTELDDVLDTPITRKNDTSRLSC